MLNRSETRSGLSRTNTHISEKGKKDLEQKPLGSSTVIFDCVLASIPLLFLLLLPVVFPDCTLEFVSFLPLTTVVSIAHCCTRLTCGKKNMGEATKEPEGAGSRSVSLSSQWSVCTKLSIPLCWGLSLSGLSLWRNYGCSFLAWMTSRIWANSPLTTSGFLNWQLALDNL